MIFHQTNPIIVFLLFFLIFPALITAGEIDPNKEYRVALVIGNSGYKNAPLLNPSNDAKDIADSLQDLGFEVVFGVDLNKQQINQKVREFSPMLKKADVGFFYFAGHGLQYKGVNYLVPVSYDIGDESEIPREALSTSSILEKMDHAGNAVNIVILDACRNNPFAGSYQESKRNLKIQNSAKNNISPPAKKDMLKSPPKKANKRTLYRSTSTGLSAIDGPSGSLIAYATAPGSVAADGNGKNGLYTLHLLEYMAQTGLSIERVFKKVRIGVMKDTGGKQIPWENSSLLGDFYFTEPNDPVSKSMGMNFLLPDETKGKTKQQQEADKFELQFWDSVEKAQSAPLYQAYIKKYPQGHFVEIAQIKLQSLSKPKQLSMPSTIPSKINRVAKVPEQVIKKTFIEETIAINDNLIVTKTNIAKPVTTPAATTPVSVPVTTAKKVLKNKNYLYAENAFVNIPSGCFTMGSPFGEEARQNDELDHQVCINKGFKMSKFEVTQAQWKKIMGRNPAYFKGCGGDCPVERVSWNDIQSFIFRLNYISGNNYRLPTEAEWEYAARSNTSTSTYAGNLELEGSNNAPGLNKISWYSGNSKVKYKGGKFCEDWEDKQFPSIRCGTQKVGKKQPNAWGLYDMIGNVWEFTEDWYGSYSSRTKDDPRGARSGDLKVARGGNWSDSLQQNRAAARYVFAVKEKSNNLGFRLVR